jgi:hypothetical protein
MVSGVGLIPELECLSSPKEEVETTNFRWPWKTRYDWNDFQEYSGFSLNSWPLEFSTPFL